MNVDPQISMAAKDSCLERIRACDPMYKAVIRARKIIIVNAPAQNKSKLQSVAVVGIAAAACAGIPYQTRLSPTSADPSCRHPKKKIGILAFGSLIQDPGAELGPKIAMRIKTQTPFPVEFGRISRTRGGAPTLVPHESGAPVSAEILVLEDDVTIEDARNMLWRRETRQRDTSRTYTRGSSENSVLVEEFHGDSCVETVLYTDFNVSGKIPNPTAADLAVKAIESVKHAKAGMDGITYLTEAIASGIETILTQDYKVEILNRTTTLSLKEAIEKEKAEAEAAR